MQGRQEGSNLPTGGSSQPPHPLSWAHYPGQVNPYGTIKFLMAKTEGSDSNANSLGKANCSRLGLLVGYIKQTIISCLPFHAFSYCQLCRMCLAPLIQKAVQYFSFETPKAFLFFVDSEISLILLDQIFLPYMRNIKGFVRC